MNTPQSEILIYQNPNGNIKIDVRLEEETVWLTQKLMAELFDKSKKTIVFRTFGSQLCETLTTTKEKDEEPGQRNNNTT